MEKLDLRLLFDELKMPNIASSLAKQSILSQASDVWKKGENIDLLIEMVGSDSWPQASVAMEIVKGQFSSKVFKVKMLVRLPAVLRLEPAYQTVGEDLYAVLSGLKGLPGLAAFEAEICQAARSPWVYIQKAAMALA